MKGWHLALKTLGLTLISAVAAIPSSGIAGFFLYIPLIEVLPPDTLAAFTLVFFPFAILGLPMLLLASRFALLKVRMRTCMALWLSTFLLGTLGFAGFWVGAMGI
jgi:hypothetical protein